MSKFGQLLPSLCLSCSFSVYLFNIAFRVRKESWTQIFQVKEYRSWGAGEGGKCVTWWRGDYILNLYLELPSKLALSRYFSLPSIEMRAESFM